jgi:uncharacterized protein involved in exopolysaccharide biosynthesis
MDLEAVNRALAATVQKQEAELKAADAEIERLRQNIRAEALDMLHGTPCAEIRWQQERETLVADNERLRVALEPFASLAYRYDPVEADDDNWLWDQSALPTISDLRRARAALGGDK